MQHFDIPATCAQVHCRATAVNLALYLGTAHFATDRDGEIDRHRPTGGARIEVGVQVALQITGDVTAGGRGFDALELTVDGKADVATGSFCDNLSADTFQGDVATGSPRI